MFEFNFSFDPIDTHSLHPYPAKFSASVPYQLIKKLAKKGDVILDPFCGSGTTLLEGLMSGCDVIGNDINYIALLISKVKTTNYCKEELDAGEQIIQDIINLYEKKTVLKYVTDFKEIDHWFQGNVRYELDLIKSRIHKIDNESLENLFSLTLSNIIIEVSNQESDTRYVEKDKNIPDGYTIDIFKKKYQLMLQKLKNLHEKKCLKISVRFLMKMLKH